MSVIAGKHPAKSIGIKQFHCFLPVAFCQIGEVKQILDIAHTGNNRLRQNRHRKRKVVLTLIGNDIESASDLLARLHTMGIEPVVDLILAAAKPVRNTLHAKIGRDHISFRHTAFRPVNREKILHSFIGMK